MSKIGTGEGAQAYGHGLYFAENEGVAKSYRDRLTHNATVDQTGGNPGHMYEVRINSDPSGFIDWDKPLSQQSDKARNALSDVADKRIADYNHVIDRLPDSPQRQDMIADLDDMIAMRDRDYMPKEMIKSREAARFMREAGIPGIKYLDSGSRGGVDGTSNFVVFDDALVEIMRKYGLLGPIGTGAVAAATGDEGPIY